MLDFYWLKMLDFYWLIKSRAQIKIMVKSENPRFSKIWIENARTSRKKSADFTPKMRGLHARLRRVLRIIYIYFFLMPEKEPKSLIAKLANPYMQFAIHTSH